MSDSQILLPGDHISWTYLLPNLRIWKVQEAPSFAAQKAAPSVPLCLLFCLEGGIQIVLEHGQIIDVTPQDILLLSSAAPVQEISQTDASQHGYIVLEGKESLPSFLNYWSVPYSQLQEKTSSLACKRMVDGFCFQSAYGAMPFSRNWKICPERHRESIVP